MSKLPDSLGNSPQRRVMNIYNLLWQEKYDREYKVRNWGKVGSLVKSMLKDYNEYQVAALLIVHFSWAGASGDNQRIKKNLEENMYPFSWVSPNANKYEVYIANVLGVDFDGDDVKRYVEQYFDGLPEG